MFRRRLLALSCLALLVGCGPARTPVYPVSGKIVFTDGQPVRSGTVELQSIEFGTTATGTIREDGTFVLGTYESDDGAAAGKHRAIVVQLIVGDGGVKHVKNHGRPVPPRYATYQTSGLTTEIRAADTNEIILSLELMR